MTYVMLHHNKENFDLDRFLRSRRLHVEELVDGYFATDSYAKRGGYVEVLVKDLSNLIATRSEIFRPVLRKVDGGQQRLDRLDEARRQQLRLLVQLDELSTGVGPRDVHQHQPHRIVELMTELRRQIHDYDEYEARELVPFLRATVNKDQLRRLGRKATKASRRGPTHTHPGRPPADERTRLGKAISAFYDRLLNYAEHPERTIETGGEQGP